MTKPINSDTLNAFFSVFEQFNKNVYIERIPSGLRAEFSESLYVLFFTTHYEIGTFLTSPIKTNQDLMVLGIKENDFKEIHEQIKDFFNLMTNDEMDFFNENGYFVKEKQTNFMCLKTLKKESHIITKFLDNGTIPHFAPLLRVY